MSLVLTVLGCSGSYASPGGACSGYLVEGGGVAIWLDAGPGTLATLQEHTDLDRLDAVILTHSHPDHWVDLLPYHNVVRYIRPRTGVVVMSPREVRRLAGEVNGELGPAFDWRVVSDGERSSVGDLQLSFSRTDHGPETLAVRIDDSAGASLAYTADTGSGWSLDALGEGIDMALCEASLAPEDEDEVQHLTAGQAGEMARRAGARRLVLTHLVPGLDAGQARALAAGTFGGPVEVAALGARYEVQQA